MKNIFACLKNEKVRNAVYVLPYFILLLIGAWYRYQISNVAYLDGDSGNYLMPPFIKQLINEWHKGERPMQYLWFIYVTLGKDFSLGFTIIMQKILGIVGAGFLAAAWVTFIKGLRSNILLWHLAGYAMLSIYISNPLLMYYEQLIGPESVSMFLMCCLIYCLTALFSNTLSRKSAAFLLAITIFVNLYLAIPMPKMLFAFVFIEIVLVYQTLKLQWLSRKHKLYLLTIPHFLYFIVGPLQEISHKIDFPTQDRTFIELKQMVFTHFNILANDKSNFEVSAELQDSLVKYFHEAEQMAPNYLIGFNSDNLMWGKAGNAIDEYFHKDFDSIRNFYFNLNVKLATNYPLELTKNISKQVTAFYVPNKFIHKELFNNNDLLPIYEGTIEMAHRFDRNLSDYLGDLTDHQVAHHQSLASEYPLMKQIEIYNPERLPMTFRSQFWFYRWFDLIFLLAMILFFVVRVFQKKLFQVHIVTLLYGVIAFYVIAVGTVHTFDINRFVTTIYPFLLVTPFMVLPYFGQELLSFLKSPVIPQSENF